MDILVKEHYKPIRQTLILVLILNWTVALAKIIYGLFTKCSSMTADGIHSLSDGASNIIGLIGIHFACQPRDIEHPYGHRKYETFFSLGIAVLLFILAFNLAREGIIHLRQPITPKININSFIVMVVTMLVNFGVMRYEYKKGRALLSDILISDAMHTRADISTSLSVVIALIAIKLGYPILDPIATIIISLFIAHTGYKIMREGQAILCDTAAILDIKKIEDIVLGIKGVKTCHNIRTRGRPDDIHLDLHVEVSAEMHMEEAHRISYAIEETIKKSIPEITDVVVHMEPQRTKGPLR
jgi:cation diffusion facilitator family transporter